MSLALVILELVQLPGARLSSFERLIDYDLKLATFIRTHYCFLEFNRNRYQDRRLLGLNF